MDEATNELDIKSSLPINESKDLNKELTIIIISPLRVLFKNM